VQQREADAGLPSLACAPLVGVGGVAAAAAAAG